MTHTVIDNTRYIKKCPDGNRYSISKKEEKFFIELTESIENAEWGSDEWMSLRDELDNYFGQHRKS